MQEIKNLETKKRMTGLELLRCLAMMMVVVLHYLGKGGLLTELTSENFTQTAYLAWFLESFCIVAVNVYMLLSGYFLSESSFKLSRLIRIWLQVEFYSVVFGLIGALTGVVTETPVDTHYYLTLLFPISMGHYWFLTAYFFLYLFLPVFGAAVKKMTKTQMQVTIVSLLCVFSVLKSVIPVRFEEDALGYDWVWYACVFLTAAYLRRFGIPFLEKKTHAIVVFLLGCLAIFGATFALRAIYLQTGHFDERLGMFMEYNHILPFLAALGLFCFFRKVEASGVLGKLVLFAGPLTLGVYLLHENIGLRYSWQAWFGAEQIDSPVSLVGGTLAAVVSVFVVGIAVEKLRRCIFYGFHKLLSHVGGYRKQCGMVACVDEEFTKMTD